MKEFSRRWSQEYPDPYFQGHRKNIPFRWVEKNATLLMTVRDGEVTFPKTIPVPPKDK
jgi:hypothetical protein